MEFKLHGQSGKMITEMLPHLGEKPETVIPMPDKSGSAVIAKAGSPAATRQPR